MAISASTMRAPACGATKSSACLARPRVRTKKSAGKKKKAKAYPQKKKPRPKSPPKVCHESASAGSAACEDDDRIMCYYPGCREVHDAAHIYRCGQCEYFYCATHMKMCGQCRGNICIICVRDVVYGNIINSLMVRGPKAAQETWARVIANVSLCPECTTTCPCCAVPALVNGKIVCKVCGRNTCMRCVLACAGTGDVVCTMCYARSMTHDSEAALLLMSLQR